MYAVLVRRVSGWSCSSVGESESRRWRFQCFKVQLEVASTGPGHVRQAAAAVLLRVLAELWAAVAVGLNVGDRMTIPTFRFFDALPLRSIALVLVPPCMQCEGAGVRSEAGFKASAANTIKHASAAGTRLYHTCPPPRRGATEGLIGRLVCSARLTR